MNAIIIDDDELSMQSLRHLVEQSGLIKLCATFSSPIPALTFLATNKVDLILLDIQMPEMNGMEFLEAIKDGEHQTIVVTSHAEFALDAYDHKVVGYLVKPIRFAKFFSVVTDVAKRYFVRNGNTADEIVFVKKDNQIIPLKMSDIHWVEALGDYAVLNTELGKFVQHSTLRAIEEKLPTEKFMRVHRSYIVQKSLIERIEDHTILCKGKEIPIGKSYKEEVFSRLKFF